MCTLQTSWDSTRTGTRAWPTRWTPPSPSWPDIKSVLPLLCNTATSLPHPQQPTPNSTPATRSNCPLGGDKGDRAAVEILVVDEEGDGDYGVCQRKLYIHQEQQQQHKNKNNNNSTKITMKMRKTKNTNQRLRNMSNFLVLITYALDYLRNETEINKLS